ncbi:adenosylmethionine--8-amino-7-oxononanoate transaminase [Zavarzinella formosa]|uniref:adenosylmethionine--8-amino-7-oxononanoate transaminase n=1 Tax=Zavarzinella formosa TaxID=360055 RepID=UPI000310B3C9|nr:adenosylmethionine--8-amino-7-oxononanoate transaminase [Zavarzinella formosa]
MSDFVVLGTDTDAGKTTFSILWLTAFGPACAYWKPLETGDSDTEKIRRLCPQTVVHPPVMRFAEPVAPPLAARREGRPIPSAGKLLKLRPVGDQPLLIETFGGPFSPLNESELQLDFIRQIQLSAVLVSNSAVGAIGRTLACLKSLSVEGIIPAAVVLLGPDDPYAVEQIGRRSPVPVFSLDVPKVWDRDGFQCIVTARRQVFADLEQVLKAPEKQRNLILRDRAAIWHPYTSLKDPLDPLPVVAAEAEYLILEDGRKIIDAVSSWWTILHGHRPPKLVAALHRAIEQLDHVIFGGATHPHAVEVAEALLKTVPWESGGRVFFSDNGSTAVEVALKMAYQWWVHQGEPQRTLFVGFENGYHGDTFGAMAIGRDPLFFGKFEPLLFNAVQIPVSPKSLDETLAREGNRIAAVVIEPLVQGAGGMQMHSPEILAELCSVAGKHGVLFIVDEVMTGGRTGSWWAHSQAKIEPDLICSSKTLAGGMLPLAATLASPKIVESFDFVDRTKTLFHGHSFTANPLACAVAAENLKMLADDNWLADVRRIENFWAANNGVFEGLPGVIAVRRRGTILAVELDVPGGYLAEVGPCVRRFSLEHGVMLRPLGNVIYAMPPLGTSDESLRRILEVMVKAIRHLHEVP